MGHLPRSFTLKDEIHKIKNVSRQNVRVLLRLDPRGVDLSRRGVHRTDHDFAVIWSRDYGKGRVLYNGLGHRQEVWDRPEIQKRWLQMVPCSMDLIPGNATPRSGPTNVAASTSRAWNVADAHSPILKDSRRRSSGDRALCPDRSSSSWSAGPTGQVPLIAKVQMLNSCTQWWDFGVAR